MKMYSVSYMWYAVIGTMTCIFFGVVIGLITANEKDAFDERLLHPLVARIARKLPGRKRTFTSDACEKTSEEKDPSERTEETVIEEVKPDILPVFTTNSSRIFDSYEGNSSTIRTRL